MIQMNAPDPSMTITYGRMPGCLTLLLGVTTLGVANAAIYLTMRRWPAVVDENGLLLRDGTRVRWDDITVGREIITQMRGVTARRMELQSTHGAISLPFERMLDADRVMQCIDKHLQADVSGLAATHFGEPSPGRRETDALDPPQSGPPGTQTFSCETCGYRWGPVGVQPFVPNAPEQQLFLCCVACDCPQTRMSAPGPDDLVCAACGAAALVALHACPRCDGPDVRWV